jgi:hypothetical protein
MKTRLQLFKSLILFTVGVQPSRVMVYDQTDCSISWRRFVIWRKRAMHKMPVFAVIMPIRAAVDIVHAQTAAVSRCMAALVNAHTHAVAATRCVSAHTSADAQNVTITSSIFAPFQSLTLAAKGVVFFEAASFDICANPLPLLDAMFAQLAKMTVVLPKIKVCSE